MLDRASLVGMACGVGLMVQPWWAGGLQAGFFVTLGAVVLQIVVGRLVTE